MNRNKILFITSAAVLAALSCFVLAFLPYNELKVLGDSLMRDGNFKSLNAHNAVIFRVLLAAAGLVFMSGAYILRSQREKTLHRWLSQYWHNLADFFKPINSPRTSLLRLALVFTITALATILRLFYLNDPMAHDEAYTFIQFSSTSIFNIATNYHLPNNHILNSLLIHVSTFVFGMQPWAVRLPAFLAGILLVPTTYALGKALFDPYSALLGAILIAILPNAIRYATFGRGYSLVALLSVLTLWLAVYLVRHKNLFAWSLLVAFSALGFYSVPVMLFPTGMVFGWLLLENLVTKPVEYASKSQFMKYWLVAGICTAGIVLLLYTPVFIYSGVEQVFDNYFVRPDTRAGYLSSMPGYLLNIWDLWTDGLPQLLTGLLAAGFGASFIFHRRLSRLRFPVQVAGILWFAALILVRRPSQVSKIWIFLQPIFMIWCAAGITGLVKNLHLKFAWNFSLAGIVVGAAVILTSIYACQVAPSIPSRWRSTGAAENTILSIKAQMTAQDLIIVDSPHDAALAYYARLHGLPDSLFNQSLPFERLFVITSRPDHQTPQGVLDQRGPDPASIDIKAAHFLFNHENLDTYLVPHR